MLTSAGGGSQPVNTAATSPQSTGQTWGSPDWDKILNAQQQGAMIPGITQIAQDRKQSTYDRTSYQNWLAQQRQQLGFTQQGLGLQSAGLGLQAQQLGQRSAYETAQQGYETQQYCLGQQSLSNQLANLRAQYGFQTQGFQQELQNLIAGYGFQQRGFGIQQGELNLAETQARQSLSASGAYTSTGARGQMEQGFGYQQAGLTLAEQQAKQQYGYQRSQLGLAEREAKQQYGYGTQQIGLQREQATVGQRAEQSGYQYQQQQLQDARNQLQLQYKQMGLDSRQVQANYQNALVNAGLQNIMTVDQLQTAIQGQRAGLQTIPPQVLQQLINANPMVAALVQQGQ